MSCIPLTELKLYTCWDLSPTPPCIMKATSHVRTLLLQTLPRFSSTSCSLSVNKTCMLLILQHGAL